MMKVTLLYLFIVMVLTVPLAGAQEIANPEFIKEFKCSYILNNDRLNWTYAPDILGKEIDEMAYRRDLLYELSDFYMKKDVLQEDKDYIKALFDIPPEDVCYTP